MKIVGLTGGIGHGKTTFASLLASQSRASRHFETWELVAEVASALRAEHTQHPGPNDLDAINSWLLPLVDIAAFSVHAHITFANIRLTEDRLVRHPEHYQKLLEYLALVQKNPELGSVEIDDTTKQTFRPLLQWLGGFLVITAGSGVWYDELLRRVAHLQSSTTELVTVGGVRYPADAERLRNAGGVIIQIDRPTLPLQDAHDITERERDLIHPDCSVRNNATLSDLASCAAAVWRDLQTHNVQKIYSAENYR